MPQYAPPHKYINRKVMAALKKRPHLHFLGETDRKQKESPIRRANSNHDLNQGISKYGLSMSAWYIEIILL
jgi:hypothetical protein